MSEEKTVTYPKFWTFVLPCGCPVGSSLADQGDIILATPTQAWNDHYETVAERKAAARKGITVRPNEDGDWELFRNPIHSQHVQATS